ncbi:MAG TPA: CPCC family cysteine-rich protein [Jiangellaceae bacterium]|nr:CPCC family cysteine-rich protein [Jiangellaceae bacterium]
MTRDGPEGDAWATTCARRAACAKLHADGALTELPCLACGYPTLTEWGGNHICVVCHWKDDDSTRDQPDRPSAVNHGLTLRQAAAHIVETGVFASPGWVWTAPEYFTPEVRAARAELVEAYERLMVHPRDSSARKDVRDGRSNLMYAIVNARR